jgi:serine protease Do
MMMKAQHVAVGGLAAFLLFSAPVISLAQPASTAPREVSGLPSLAPLVESVKSAVVNVDVQSRVTASQFSMGEDPEDLFDRFFGAPGRGGRRRGREQIRQGLGSGFIIDPNGTVLTNNHVVEGAVAIRVRLDDGRAFDAQVVGRDPLTDVAVIKLKGKVEKLPFVRLGDSDAMRVGDWVVAIGNPFGLTSSVSAGIISASGRHITGGPYDDFLQTDAAINPGNSGGPLFNLRGEVIGINTAIVGGGTGIGFAVPSNLAKALLPQLEKGGAITRGYLGVGIQDLTPEVAKALSVPVNEGAVVTQVQDGPAKKAGVRVDDAVVAVDGQKINSSTALSRTVALKQPNSVANLTLYRGGNKMDVKVTLGTRPDLEHVSSSADEGSGEEKQQKQVGITIQNVDPRLAQSMNLPAEGALITEVVPGSPAERAGLAPGNVIVEAAKKPIRNRDDLLKAIRSAKSGSDLLLRVVVPTRTGPSHALRVLTVP